jgi:hypothetical protein
MQFHLIHLRPDPAVVQQIVQSDPSPGPPPSSQSAIGPCPRCSPERHHQQRTARLRPGGRRSRRLLRSSRAEQRRYLAAGQRGGATTRGTAAAVPPAPRCFPNAARRGGELFAHAKACGFGHRSRHRTPISGSIKVRVLTRAKGRCECCCAHEHQRALEVDHIVPRNHAGSDDLSNLQALCFRCNAGKRWEARGGLCVLRAGGQRPGAAGERTGAVHRRCLSGDAWAQPGDPAAAWG